MAVGGRRRGSRQIALLARARLWLAAVSLLFAGVVAAQAQEGAERFSAADLINGKTANEDDCNATSAAVWVTSVPGGPACIRYYFSAVGGEKPKALVMFASDFTQLGANGRAQAPADYGALSPASVTAEVDSWSRRYGGPVIILARPGTYGSSGREVMDSGTRREIDLIDATLEAIKDRQGLEGFHLAGLGEGGNIAATLGIRRSDVGCIVAAFSPLSRRDYLSLTQATVDPALLARLNDPLQALAKYRPRRDLRMIIMGEPTDRLVPAQVLVTYMAAARDVGLGLVRMIVPPAGPNERAHHMVEAGLRCGLGEADRAIFAAIVSHASPLMSSGPQVDPPVRAPSVEPPGPRIATEAMRQAPQPQIQAQGPSRSPAGDPFPPGVVEERQESGPREPAWPPQSAPQPQVQAALPPLDKLEVPLVPVAPAPVQAMQTPTAKPQEKFSRADVLAGRTIDEATCQATPFTVWVTNVGSPECIRYYYSAAGGQGARALLFMNGDFTYRGTDGQPTVDASYDDIGPKDMQRIADVRSRDYGGPMVYLARPGTLGSSGHELKLRHTPREVALVTAAIAEIKRRHLISTFDVVGQSGGGLLLGALVATRNDIGCAISASGVLATNDWISGRLKQKATHDGTLYDPIEHVADIRPGPDFRFFVLTDAEDERVPPQSTDLYLKALAAQGIAYRQIGLTSPDPAHHDLALHGIRAAIACAHGALDTEIASLLTKTVVTQPHMSEMSPIGDMPKAGTLAPSRKPTSAPDLPKWQVAPQPQRSPPPPVRSVRPPDPTIEPAPEPGGRPALPIGHDGTSAAASPTLWFEDEAGRRNRANVVREPAA
ncbi:MAG: hypothetical protein P4L98_18375 [Ancalomicrobiaceae bacterium]|nr:hypothetical protein [Ancalomicrobiaceae bacterium]